MSHLRHVDTNIACWRGRDFGPKLPYHVLTSGELFVLLDRTCRGWDGRGTYKMGLSPRIGVFWSSEWDVDARTSRVS